MTKNKNPFPLTNIKNTKTLLRNFKIGKKSLGALLYWIFLPFMEDHKRKSKTTIRLHNLSYKILKRFPITAVQFLRLYGRSVFKEDFIKWLDLSTSQKSKKPINVRVDGSKTGQKYGFIIPELQWLFDYVTKSKMLTHEIYVMLVSIGNKDYIVDFQLKKKIIKGTNKIVQNMVYNLYNSLGKLKPSFKYFARISLDGAFGNGEMLKWFNKHDFKNVVLKSGGKDICNFNWNGRRYKRRLKDLEKFLENHGLFKKFNPCHKLSCDYVELLVEISDVKVKVVLLRFKRNKKQGYRYLLLLSLKLDWYAYQIIQTYKGRWPIETMFRTTKQCFDLECYSFHSKNTTENIEMHLALRFIGYMWLNWYRIEHTRPSRTSLKDVVIRWKKYLNGLSPKAFQLLFSG